MNPLHTSNKRIAIFISFTGQGGVERMVATLAGGIAERGYEVDLVLARAEGEHLDAIPDNVRVINLQTRHTWTSIPRLARYLRHNRPVAMLAAKHRAMLAAIKARRRAGTDTRIVGRLGTTVSGAMAGQHPLRRWLWYRSMRSNYGAIDHIIAVSQGVADDVTRISGLDPHRISVVRNPVVTPRLLADGASAASHPWLIHKDIPVIVGAGRLTRQKDFDALIRAFAVVRQQMDCRLIIFGEGKLRPQLEQLIADLELGDSVDLPGFKSNPHAELSKADLFVLSSRWEGSPNVLTEALALGIPAVSTDCPSGPVELLQDGKYGPLVAMGDVTGLSRAMIETLNSPLPAEKLQEAVANYHIDKAVDGYLTALLDNLS